MDNLAPSQQFDFYSAGLASGVQDIYSPFLGPSPRVPEGNPYDKRNTAKFNLPEDKMGKSLYLRDTMEDFMLTAKWTFWTERIMPWYRTDQIHVQWTEWENNPAYMGVVPHQTTSRVVTQRRTIRKASIIRRGIAAEFEEGFIKTDLGRTSFWASLKQMARSVQETANVEVLRALMHCHRFQQNYTLKYGIVQKDDLDAWLERKAERFMISQKHEKGLEVMNNFIDREQEQWGGKANVWILGREIMDYCSLIPPGKTWYYLGGQEAVDRLNGRPEGRQAVGDTMGNIDSLQPIRMIKDTPVFIAKSYAVEGIGKAELLSRITEIGIYNLMVDRTKDYHSYRTEGRAIRVYNNDRDGWSDIQLIDAIRNCGMWNDDAEGTLYNPFTGARNGHIGSDDDQDFLSKRVGGGGARVNIDVIGDMDTRFLDTTDLLNAGQTLIQSLAFHDRGRMPDVHAALQTGNAAQYGEILARLRDLVGGDRNPLFGVGGTLADYFPTLQGQRAGEVAANGLVYRPAFRGAAQGRPTRGGPAASSGIMNLGATVQTWFDEVLGAAVPDSHKTRFQTIASAADQSWETRSQQVKALVVEANAADPNSTGRLKTKADIDKWHAGCEKQLRKEIGADVAPASIGTSATPAAGAKIEYLHANQPLPEGYEWAGPALPPLGSSLTSFPGLAKSLQNLQQGAGAQRGGSNGGRRLIGGYLQQAPGAPYAPGQQEQARQDASIAQGSGLGFAGAALANRIPEGFEMLDEQVRKIWQAGVPTYLKMAATCIACMPVTRQRLEALARNHVAIPFGFLLFRPHCTYKTRFGIKCAANGETGYTMFGNSNFMLAHEAARMVGMMHYTAYLSAVVLYPKNVFVVEDLWCERYLGGMGVTFWKPERYQQAQANRRAASIICVPLPPSIKELEEKIDIRGRWYTEYEMGLVTQDRYDRPLYPGAARMNDRFKWYDNVRKDRGANRGRVAMNYVCWQGMEWYYNTKTGTWDDFTVESGNMGPKVYPGCGKVRNGQMMHLEDPGYGRKGGLDRF